MKYYFKKEKKKEALKGLKINYIAEQLDYCVPYMYDIFNGVCSCNERLINKICDYLNVKKEDYFEKR